MDKIIKNKRSLERVTSHSSDYKNSFITYILSDQVWLCNIKQFLSYSKITSANLCKPIPDTNYSTSIYPFVSGKCRKEVKNYKNLISRERKQLFRWNKNNFHSFWKAIIWWKNKNLIKNSRPKLQCLQKMIIF